MAKKYFVCVLAVTMAMGMGPSSLAIEKLKFATAVKVPPVYYLPMMAAEEQGFWKKNGLDGEWVPFEGSVPMFRAMAAGDISIGFTGAMGAILAASRGLPAVFVSDLYSPDDFRIWVRTDSPIRAPIDLKGGKIDVGRRGDIKDFYTQAMAKALGIEKDVKILASGGIPQELAALKTAAVDAIIEPINVMINLKLAGEVREVASIVQYLPKEWVGFGIVATRDLVGKNPDTLKRAVRAVIEAVNFIKENPGWSIGKMKIVSGFSEEAARLLYYEDLRLSFTNDGKFTEAAVKNVRDFFIEYSGTPREKVPPVEELYTKRFLP